METYEVDIVCPHCGEKTEAHTTVEPDARPPQDGDVGFCWTCRKGTVYAETDDGLKMVTVEEYDKFDRPESKGVEAKVSLMEECSAKAIGPLEAASMFAFATEHGFVPNPQIVRFYMDADERDQIGEIRWPHDEPWPPPERFMRITDINGRTAAVCEFDAVVAAVDDKGNQFGEGYKFERFDRSKCSNLTVEDMGASKYLSRGATYVYGGDHEWA